MYDNSVAKLWIRPRVIFEENVESEGKVVRRFEKVDLRLEAFDRGPEVEESCLPIVHEGLGRMQIAVISI